MAIAILKLATPSSLHYIASLFSVAKSMARKAVRGVFLVIQNVLANHFIHLINTQEVVTSFHHLGFPNCVGAMDDTSVPILCLPQGTWAFFSVILQGIANHGGHFTDIFAGWVGSAHDAGIFCDSPIPQLLEIRHYTSEAPSFIIGTILIPLLIIGDPAYPLLPSLMKPYGGSWTTERSTSGTLQQILLCSFSSRFGKKKEDKGGKTDQKGNPKHNILREEELEKMKEECERIGAKHQELQQKQARGLADYSTSPGGPDIDDDEMDPNYARVNHFREVYPVANVYRPSSPLATETFGYPCDGPQVPVEREYLEGLYAKINKHHHPQATGDSGCPVSGNADRIQKLRKEYHQARREGLPFYEDDDGRTRSSDYDQHWPTSL
ncbi:hypothetical protein Y1Q_0008637 [Alligator mississippiensis]|uniref:DDE Tnp4 domain-containing protein n=1 Tax=Alligator mississippiensis TaxID=8496 RepID=A0A151N9I6_ALLMI|nr:hypothetical protein Y1Q_0008637 [Alligator mississippiensis]